MGRSVVVAGAAVALLAAACTGGGSPPGVSPTTLPARTPSASPSVRFVSIPGCPHAPSPTDAWKETLVEIQGIAEEGQLWALVFLGPGTPIRAGRQVKIAWRMTGSGDLALVAVNGDNVRVSPDQMQPHEGSNWDRPGKEWGTLFTFPKTGCWDIHAQRASVAGDVWVSVN